MKRLIVAVAATVAVCFVFFLSACGNSETTPLPEPLTMEDCFKDFVPTVYFKPSNKPQGYEDEVYSGEHFSLLELMKSENNIEANRYSFFQVFTTEKASLIEVSSISFNVVVTEDSILQFCLATTKEDTLYSNSVTATAGNAVTITFSGLHKRWTDEEAGASEIRAGWLIGEPSTYLRIDLVNKADFVQNSYSIQNLKIEFTEL